jgi:hypothetical protein
MQTATFKYGNKTIKMELGYLLATTTISDLGVDVLSVMKDPIVIQTIMLDDSVMLKIWYYYVKEETGDDWKDALGILDQTPGGLKQFKDAFWDMVVGFSPHAVQEAMKDNWKRIQKELKKSVETNSNSSSSSSSPEPE